MSIKRPFRRRLYPPGVVCYGQAGLRPAHQKAWKLVSQTQVETNRQPALLEEELGAEAFSILATLLQKTNLILERKKEA